MLYQNFFGLSASPFNLTPDPRFFFCSKNHQEALSHVLFGVRERRGFIVITGEVGTGKTTLCRLLLQRIDPTVKTSLLFNANMETTDLLRAINQDFGLPGTGETKKALVDELNRFLLGTLERGENALLIIDEAQNLSTEAMEEIRLLSNLETEREKLIQILLIGQTELREKLSLDKLRQLNQRITLRYDIPPLDLPETRQYLDARLKAAGGEDRVFFTPDAVEEIYRFSGGIPRLINVAADGALLTAYVAGSRTINRRLVQEGLKEISGGTSRVGRNPATRRRLPARLILASAALFLLAGGGYFARKESPVGSFDRDGVFRVASAEESRSAAYLSLLRIWGKGPESPGDLSDPGAADRWVEASGLSVYSIPLIASRIALFDYPLLLQISGEQGARWVVLFRLSGESAELLDPMAGRSKVKIKELESRWIGEGTLLWKRLSGIEDPLPDRGESVRSLQVLLADEGLLPLRKFDGFFGRLTRKAILDFQARAGLETDGKFNPETHLVLARLRRHDATPSLSLP
jgi:general secretion pathway protein A